MAAVVVHSAAGSPPVEADGAADGLALGATRVGCAGAVTDGDAGPPVGEFVASEQAAMASPIRPTIATQNLMGGFIRPSRG
jgi:hypothetical protein